MKPTFAPTYFADENTLGFATLMRRSGRLDVFHPGHPDLLGIPLGSKDLEWMPLVGRMGLIVITRDRRIRSRPAELAAYREHGIRSVWIGAHRDMSSADQMLLFLQHEQRLRREIVKRGAGPWALALTSSGVRPLGIREVD